MINLNESKIKIIDEQTEFPNQDFKRIDFKEGDIITSTSSLKTDRLIICLIYSYNH
jgi:hypothetical protein